MPRFRRILGLLALPIVLSGGLRIFHLARSSYWLDEMVSLDLATGQHWYAVFSDNNPPLYGLILRSWAWVFGDAEAATRAIAVICSVLATVFVMMAVWRIRKQWSATVLAGGFHAVSILSLSFAQQTRMYGLFEMWMALSLYFFVRVLRERKHLVGYILTCLAMALTHYLAVVPISIELVILLLASRPIGRKRVWVLGLCFVGVIGAQGWIFAHFFKWQGVQWQLLKSSSEPHAFWPGELLWMLGNGTYLSGVIVALLWTLGIFQLLSVSEEERSARISLITLVAAPVLLFIFATLLTGRALLLPRYFVYLAPPFCASLGLAAARAFGRANSARKTLAAALAGIFVVGSGAGLRDYYSQHREPWREAAALVGKYPGSIVCTTRTLALRTPYFNRIGVEVKKLPEETSRQVSEIAQLVGQGKKVWVLENFWGGYHYMPELKQVLVSLHLEVSELSLRDGNSPPVFAMMVEKP